MIEAAYPLLYGREAAEAEVTAGLQFLEERRADFLAEELEEAADIRGHNEAAERRASMQAWIQYARALFSTAEFRFVG
ncbi:hypothetical protein [Candidatus Palauibacter sp.]|uniref:hypothetical protein n=1 Tax=Candidatus Palauibacter sp. TaxID=3101350 RepID=UPI003AF25CB5